MGKGSISKVKGVRRKPRSPSKPDAATLDEARVQVRAYEIYLARGATPGNDLRDWLQAQQELRGDRP